MRRQRLAGNDYREIRRGAYLAPGSFFAFFGAGYSNCPSGSATDRALARALTLG